MTEDDMNAGGHEDLPPKDPGENCNARKTDGSGYCGQPAGWGTDHDVGRCKFHGGNTRSQEKGLIAELEEAAEHASTALKLQLKHMLADLEDGEDVDPAKLDKLARTVLDRTDHGPTETREVTGEDGGPVEVELNETVVETGYDE
jgi:hypothetical protein